MKIINYLFLLTLLLSCEQYVNIDPKFMRNSGDEGSGTQAINVDILGVVSRFIGGQFGSCHELSNGKYLVSSFIASEYNDKIHLTQRFSIIDDCQYHNETYEIGNGIQFELDYEINQAFFKGDNNIELEVLYVGHDLTVTPINPIIGDVNPRFLNLDDIDTKTEYWNFKFNLNEIQTNSSEVLLPAISDYLSESTAENRLEATEFYKESYWTY